MQRIFSSGGGVQSTACLVLSVQGKIDFPTHVFANVGDNAESPKTIAYVKDVLIPYAEKNGIEWVEVARTINGTPVDLYDFSMECEHTIPLPVRLSGSGAPGNRTCTSAWKIQPIAKYLKELIPTEIHQKARAAARRAKIDAQGMDVDSAKQLKATMKRAVYDTYPVILGQGISTDEIHRCRTQSGFDFYRVNYPLIDLELSRADCHKIIAEAGLPQPPKSSCWFCPYTKFSRWQEMSTQDPETFAKAVEMERTLSNRATKLGRGKTYFTDKGVKRNAYLDVLVSNQISLFPDSEDFSFCESGYCMT
jgi:hypothetical protein